MLAFEQVWRSGDVIESKICGARWRHNIVLDDPSRLSAGRLGRQVAPFRSLVV